MDSRSAWSTFLRVTDSIWVRETLLRYLSAVHLLSLGTQDFLELPFGGSSTQFGHARLSCVTFRRFIYSVWARVTLLRYLSAVRQSSLGTRDTLALPFGGSSTQFGHARLSCVTFRRFINSVWARVTCFRYLSAVYQLCLGTQDFLALPFGGSSTQFGHARLSCVTFRRFINSVWARKTFLRYLSAVHLLSLGTQDFLALPFGGSSIQFGHARHSCVTFRRFVNSVWVRVTCLRYLSAVHLLCLGTRDLLALPFGGSSTLFGHARLSCVTFRRFVNSVWARETCLCILQTLNDFFPVLGVPHSPNLYSSNYYIGPSFVASPITLSSLHLLPKQSSQQTIYPK